MDTLHNKSIYLQLADTISNRILSGYYRPEERIPSVRELAAEMQINANTVLRTFDYLSANGIIYNRRGIGYFITAEAPSVVREMRRRRFFESEADYFFGTLHRIGVSPDALRDMYAQFLTQNKNNQSK